MARNDSYGSVSSPGPQTPPEFGDFGDFGGSDYTWPAATQSSYAYSLGADDQMECLAEQADASNIPSGRGSQPRGEDRAICLFPGCTQMSFRHKADLDRHLKHVHVGVPEKEGHYCDYPRCSRRNDPFGRRDHYRDHLRSYHKEDVLKKHQTERDLDMGKCNISPNFWRCPRCLSRIAVATTGWDCPKCLQKCPSFSRKAREAARPPRPS